MIRGFSLLLRLVFVGRAFALDNERQLGVPFLDPQGRLLLPEGYSGNLDPSGFQMVGESEQAPRFVAKSQARNGGAWTGFGGLRDGYGGELLAM